MDYRLPEANEANSPSRSAPSRIMSGRRTPKTETETGSEDRFELLVRAVIDYAIYMLDPEGIVTSWNAGAERLKGYTESEIVGRDFAMFFTAEDRAAGKPAHALRVAADSGRWEDEVWHVRKDGSRFWALAVLDAIRDEQGQLVGFAKITRDITERRMAQEALAESERRFRLLVESATDYAIFMLDTMGVITTWNVGAERIKGYSEEEIIGQHFSVFYTEEDRINRVPEFALDTAKRTGRFQAESWRVRKSGKRFWASVVINAIHDDDGRLVGFAKITRDLTERRAAEEQLRQAQKMEAIGQLTGGVAHDFNNLLTVIGGNVETLERHLTAEDPTMLRFIHGAMRGVERAAILTSRLLAFGRRQPLDPKPLEMNRLIIGLSDLLGRTIGEHIQIETVFSGGLWQVAADANQLENAVLNLAVNARDAMPSGGKLTIETANAHLDEIYAAAHEEVKAGQYVMVAVSDTGQGIPKEIIGKVFDPFFTTKKLGEGTGLGLSQVYGFIKQSGGHVKIYSEPGEGTTVRLYLPRLITEETVEVERKDPPAPGTGGAETILVVEDDIDVRAYSTETLRELGYHVLEASEGDAALGLIVSHPEIKLLFTDVGLPGAFNGRYLADEARKRRPELKVLFTTGYARNAIVHHGRLDPGVNLIAKPFTFAALAAKVRAVLDEEPKSG